MKKHSQLFIILIFIFVFVTLINRPSLLINKNIQLNMVNQEENYSDNIKDDIVMRLNGIYLDPLIGTDRYFGTVKVKFGTVDNEYTFAGTLIENTDSAFLIRRMMLENEVDSIIQDNRFENIVICEMNDGVCLFKDRYILSTFDNLEDTKDYLNEFYEERK